MHETHRWGLGHQQKRKCIEGSSHYGAAGGHAHEPLGTAGFHSLRTDVHPILIRNLIELSFLW